VTRYFLKVMPDYYSSGLWDQNEEGAMTELRNHIEVSCEVIALEKDLYKWNQKYDKTISWSNDRPNPSFDRDSFHEEGLMLAKRLKQLMGHNGKVIYFKEADLVSSKTSEEILIQDEEKTD
jgi:hypothetical protein